MITETLPRVFLSDLSDRDSAWDKHRSLASLVTAAYDGTDYQTYADRMGQCSTLLGFAWELDANDVQQLKLKNARFCHVRHCPVCQWRRSLVWYARFKRALPKIVEEHPDKKWVFLTLTVRNCPVSELRNTVQIMSDSWKRMSHRKAFPGKGWVRSLEVTRNPVTGEAHPHYHALLLVNKSYFNSSGYLSHEAWTQLWQDSARLDYRPIVNVKAVKPQKRNGHTDQADAIMAAVCETLKYSVKPEELVAKQDWLLGVTEQLHRVRSVNVGGVLRHYMRDEDPTDLLNPEGESDDDLPLLDIPLWFGWKEVLKRYQQSRHPLAE